ncbi:MAG: hypothetical protein JRN24_00215, partial [Nitrososphaerota archaeon]|nr:hypothetical protein [Nitrososphaerota archaeon]
MPTNDRSHALDHLVVIMFENRSFDNLLGYLYQPGEVPSFEGILGRDLSNSIPSDVAGADQGFVRVHPAANLDTPDPDPGEEHPHTNTQLFGTVAPATNRFASVDDMKPPFNAPDDPSASPTMDGFVADYVNSFRQEIGTLPGSADYAQIMACYTPEQMPVVRDLARGFAVFDHWFCEVPSQTYCNRSFVHAGTSSGLVLNSPPGTFARKNTAETVFERLQKAGRSWKVYIDPRQLLPATGLIHGRNLLQFGGDHFSTIFDFYDEAERGELPDYAFIEPNMFHPHTDMHPPGLGRVRRELHLKPPNAMLGGEDLLAKVYNAVRDQPRQGRSNYANTFLLVTFDEHGGTYDHVPPPRVAAPNPAGPPGEEGFRFDRSGVRVPAIAISAWLAPKTVVNQEYRHTSVIRTLRDTWDIGGPLTQRDASAASLAALPFLDQPRPPEEWPKVTPRSLGLLAKLEEDLERAFGGHLFRLEHELAGEAL